MDNLSPSKFKPITYTRKIDLKILKLASDTKSQKKISHRKHITLRSENISNLTSLIAIYPFVRKFVNNQQKLAVYCNRNFMKNRNNLEIKSILLVHDSKNGGYLLDFRDKADSYLFNWGNNHGIHSDFNLLWKNGSKIETKNSVGKFDENIKRSPDRG